MNISMYWPIAIAVVSDIVYQIASKSTPQNLNAFASLTITYLVAAAASAVLFFVTGKGGSLLQEWRGVNWSALVLGLAIVGLEFGSMYMYRIGWPVNTGYVVRGITVAVLLVFVGWLLYHEQLTLSKGIGITACLPGLFLINR